MTDATRHRKLTQAELLDEARARFGDAPMKWAFQCPSCGDIAIGEDFREVFAGLPGMPSREASGAASAVLDVAVSAVLGQECIGRTLGVLAEGLGSYTGRGCDRAAYGLFSGPWEVVLPNGRSTYAFPLAPAS